VLLAVALPLILALAGADTVKAAPQKPSPVRFTGDIGYVATSGNSSVQTLNVGDKVAAKFGRTTLSQQFAVINGRSKGQTVVSIWRAALRVDAAIAKKKALYTSLTYERNTFAGLASRTSAVTGLSAEVVGTSKDKLVLEGGVSLTAQRATATKGSSLDFLGGRAATVYQHHLNPRAVLAQSIEFLPNFRQSEDLRINSETSALAPLTRQVGIKLSYAIRFDGLPPPGYLSTDHLFTSGIQISL
jgi:putative salt-induced outer membrane protein YdiY